MENNMAITFNRLAHTSNAAVCYLSYTVFDEKVVSYGGWCINLISCLMEDGFVDSDILPEWSEDNADFKQIKEGGASINYVMDQLAAQWNKYNCHSLWGDRIDISIAEYYFKGRPPWFETSIRDPQTLFKMTDDLGSEYKGEYSDRSANPLAYSIMFALEFIKKGEFK